MQAMTQQRREQAPTRDGPILRLARPTGRFLAHYAEMCMAMCAGTVALSLLIFGVAGRFGYSDLPERAPELTALILAFNLSVPMLLWMRFRGMAWRPTIEMSGASVVTALLLIGGLWAGIVPRGTLLPLQINLACPVMLAAMLVRFRLYSASHGGARARHAVTPDS